MAEEVDDIEDLPVVADVASRPLRSVKPQVQSVKRGNSANDIATEQPLVPGTQKIWVKTFGCAHNSSDSEYMAGQLQAYGYR